MKLLFRVVFLLGLASSEAGAADLSSFGGLGEAPPPPEKSPFELRLGVFAHDPQSPEKGSADLNGEILLGNLNPSPLGSWWNILILRPQMGGTLNFVGKTSALYGGLTGTVYLYRGLFLEASFGGAANDGKAGAVVPPGYNAMGCNVSFHENASIGYRLSENWSLMGTIEHYSNKGFCVRNRGLTNYGARLGYSF
ncbi:acyloxyacyl hydrolase [Rhodoblastus sp.]|uniref:acyloxyacyl hydrolase n=1 Tax=Rhodoblastus sp. TaxID=1962975 RepID=UPI003F9B5DF4